jgi:hypothetical protein
MSRWHHWRVMAALAVALLLSCTVQSWAQSIAPGDEAEQARLEKARAVTPQKPSTLSRLIFKLDDDLLLERPGGPSASRERLLTAASGERLRGLPVEPSMVSSG